MLHKVKKGILYKQSLQTIYDNLKNSDEKLHPGAKIVYHAQPAFHPIEK